MKGIERFPFLAVFILIFLRCLKSFKNLYIRMIKHYNEKYVIKFLLLILQKLLRKKFISTKDKNIGGIL